MPYHLCDHIYIAQFRDELVLLDVKSNKYTICFQEISSILLDLLETQKTTLVHNPKRHKDTNLEISSVVSSQRESREANCFQGGDFCAVSERVFLKRNTFYFKELTFNPEIIQQLINDHIIEEKNTPFLFHIDRKPHSDGVSNVDWRLPLENKRVSLSIDVFKALMTLIKVNLYIKVRGFYSSIRLIKKSRKINITYIVPSTEELRDLATIVNKACLIYPTRTKCLEWAMTFVLLALKRSWKCNLEIGVQNYPFIAHAWVECDGQVVMDSQDLREGLGIILNEPFRKVKA